MVRAVIVANTNTESDIDAAVVRTAVIPLAIVGIALLHPAVATNTESKSDIDAAVVRAAVITLTLV